MSCRVNIVKMSVFVSVCVLCWKQSHYSTHNRITDTTVITSEDEPTLQEQLELVYRKVASGLRTNRQFIRDRGRQAAKSYPSEGFLEMLSEVDERISAIQIDLAGLERVGDLIAWRNKEAAELSLEVQRRLDALQNPKDCRSAWKLVTTPHKPFAAGFGVVLHELVRCFMAAYAKGRMFVLHSKGFRYSPNGWEEVFLPLSNTCNEKPFNVTDSLDDEMKNQVIFRKSPITLAKLEVHQPRAVPHDVASRISKFHEDPGLWWMAQFMGYLLRPQPTLEKLYQQVMENLNFTRAIVAIHLRRTDKIYDLDFIPVENYMTEVEQIFRDLELASPLSPPLPRRVFLATEEPEVLEEVKRKYPKYEFVWHPNNAKDTWDRFNTASLMRLMTDIYILSHSDFLVCTFSSNICRVAYEVRQYLRPDGVHSVVSVDSPYYLEAERKRFVKVRYAHHPDKIAKERGFGSVEAGEELRVLSEKNIPNDDTVKVCLGNNKNVCNKAFLPNYKAEHLQEVVNVTLPQNIILRK